MKLALRYGIFSLVLLLQSLESYLFFSILEFQLDSGGSQEVSWQGMQEGVWGVWLLSPSSPTRKFSEPSFLGFYGFSHYRGMIY